MVGVMRKNNRTDRVRGPRGPGPRPGGGPPSETEERGLTPKPNLAKTKGGAAINAHLWCD